MFSASPINFEYSNVSLWLLGFLLLVLLLMPAINFLWFGGWANRKSQILSSFKESAVVYYLQRFHGAEARELIRKLETLELTADQSRKDVAQKHQELDAATAALKGLPADAKPEERNAHQQKVDELQRQAQHTAQELNTADGKLAAAQQEGLDWLQRYYNGQFGKRGFMIPLALLFAIAAFFISFCVLTALRLKEKLAADDAETIAVLTVVLAILGGYTWVVSDLIDRARRDDLTASDLLWSSFRLVIAVPVGYAFGKVFNSANALPMAYLLGTLPTGTLMTIGRRAVAKWVQSSDTGDQSQTEIQKLVSVDIRTAERLADEGITSNNQLAYADPVRLCIRTGINFGAILCSAGEALLAMYLTERGAIDKEKLSAVRKYGISGAYECAFLWRDLNNPAKQARADAIVTSLAHDLGAGYTKEGVLNILFQVATDPYTQFQLEVWK
jgi:hypothetical protein